MKDHYQWQKEYDRQVLEDTKRFDLETQKFSQKLDLEAKAIYLEDAQNYINSSQEFLIKAESMKSKETIKIAREQLNKAQQNYDELIGVSKKLEIKIPNILEPLMRVPFIRSKNFNPKPTTYDTTYYFLK